MSGPPPDLIWAVLVLAAVLAWLVGAPLARRGWQGGVESFLLGVLLGPVLGWFEPAGGAAILAPAVSGTLLGFAVGLHCDLRWFREVDQLGVRGATTTFGVLVTGLVLGALALRATGWMDVRLVPLLAVAVLSSGALAVVGGGTLTARRGELSGVALRGVQRLGSTLTALGLAAAFVASLVIRHQVVQTLPAAFYLALGGALLLVGLAAWCIVGLSAYLPARTQAVASVVVMTLLAVLGDGLGVFVPFLGFVAGLLVSLWSRDFVRWARRLDGWYPVLASPLLVVAGASWSGRVAPWIFALALAFLVVRYGAQRVGFAQVSRSLGDDLHGLVWPTTGLALAVVLETEHLDAVWAFGDWRAAMLLALAVVLLTSRSVVRRSLARSDAGEDLT